MKPTSVLETCLYVDDLETAEEFYRNVLGLEFVSRLQGRHVFLRCGDGVFLLFNPDRTADSKSVPSHGAHGPGHVAFAMDETEIPAWQERLREHGVEIEQEIKWPAGDYSLYFRDPAGNSLELATPKLWHR
jgi:catechol 2,3-dioxygenase-like lactoylglutathione lyase family enzyme